MTAIDWIIVGFVVLMAIWGFSGGLLTGALALAGFAAGAVVGSRVGPLLLEEGSRSPYASLLGFVGALVIGVVFAMILELLGFHLRGRLGEGFAVLDGIGGALLIACLGLGLVWLAGAALLHTPEAREIRRDIQRSKILAAVNETLPPSGPLLNALARFDPFPRIDGPPARVAPPRRAILRDSDVRAAGASVVRVLGTACGLGVQGSGWMAGNGVVVTNAHVVAGQDDTTVQRRGQGPRHEAQAIWFDPENDLAILSVAGLRGAPELALDVGAPVGSSGAILGFPDNGPYDRRPARLGRTSRVISKDAYGRGPIRRRITALRGRVRSGNSGGPMVNARGRVVTTVFGSSRGEGNSGFGVPASTTARALARAGRPVDTGPCAG